MPRIGTIWPHSPTVAPVFGAKITRAVAMGSQLGDNPLAIVFDGGGRDAAVLALTEDAARQLARDLVASLGPDPAAPPADVKPVEVKPADVKPVEVKPGRGPEPGHRR